MEKATDGRLTQFVSWGRQQITILYTVLTTICAFLSLVFSGIKPIIDFGWMMTMGLTVSITVTFLLLPSLLSLLTSNENINVKDNEKTSMKQFFLHKKAKKQQTGK